MAVSARGKIGAGVYVGSQAQDMGFTSVAPPGYIQGPSGVLGHGSTWVAIAAAGWLAIMYLHFHTY